LQFLMEIYRIRITLINLQILEVISIIGARKKSVASRPQKKNHDMTDKSAEI
jgi:hypothetical protein